MNWYMFKKYWLSPPAIVVWVFGLGCLWLASINDAKALPQDVLRREEVQALKDIARELKLLRESHCK